MKKCEHVFSSLSFHQTTTKYLHFLLLTPFFSLKRVDFIFSLSWRKFVSLSFPLLFGSVFFLAAELFEDIDRRKEIEVSRMKKQGMKDQRIIGSEDEAKKIKVIDVPKVLRTFFGTFFLNLSLVRSFKI